MQSGSSLAVKVGIFFTIAIIIGLALSLQVTKAPWAGGTYNLEALFKQSSGIEKGTKVLLRGMPVGRVEGMEWDPSRFRVQVKLEIEDKYRIPRNAVAKIQASSLLGGNVINITFEEGEPAVMRYLNDGDPIDTIDTASIDEVLATLSELSDETKELIGNLNRNQETTMAKINAVIDENREYFNQTSEEFAVLGPKLNTLADRLNDFTQGMQAGEGTLGKLYTDTKLYDQMQSFMDSAQEVAQQVRSGEGTLGKLIYDETSIDDMKTMMTDIQRAAREVEGAVTENREELRKLMASLSDAGPRIEQAIANFREISEKINNSEGTLGRLINDPSLYEDAQRTINQVGESFESGEEQGVFRSFLGVIFGALI